MKRVRTQAVMVAVTMFLVFGFYGIGLACHGFECELEGASAGTDVHNQQQASQQVTPLPQGMKLESSGWQHIWGELSARAPVMASFEAYAGHQIGMEKDLTLNGGEKIGTVFSYATAEAFLSGSTAQCENPKFNLSTWHSADTKVKVDWNQATAGIKTNTGFSLTAPKDFTSAVRISTLDGYNFDLPSGGNMSGYTQTDITK